MESIFPPSSAHTPAILRKHETCWSLDLINPELKSSSNFIALQNELSNTESRLANARSAYNNSVTTYNTAVKTFPSNLVASMFKFTPADLFEVSNEKARENVKVEF